MPHVNIKHFPASLTESGREALMQSITEAVQQAFGCNAGAVSIALESVPADDWDAQVYRPEIAGRQHLLSKIPSYGSLSQGGHDA
jgi:4-oxalocrotonate tautomerase